ncbi:membrane-bound lytic murein transglycosylase MltF [Alkalilimnicola ehrlichii MLHE-1]|uniref:Membrane-bound lytic murein transglycosylase F 1 n=1 Tax=Alkalilimnicola ehrlichii (strain ATCC BAA-1101 / DSM 17681 / MLHE-1) TaxID=187272 RepID=MLTF1_ALKEH|nr:membrane-bound lytic murein transglycosylase MltF [Alkalilimnicola ehrlichii]Q0A9W6.1 RecName: Full=Membrane-bound lytic murein transglycosylase F 1; AltName: Full=Murein lyase F 1; Flags: Precursor [Alkalilimnicola ehrlichii MLHE-1]ABI56371.1 Lytic transglycosylase, catalytic [Alkalilimnicola ehrlichii MLHE-1]
MRIMAVRLVAGAITLALMAYAWLAWERARDPEPITILERVLERGELRVITRISATTYYQTDKGRAGLEFELAQAFAHRLGVQLRMLVAPDLEAIFAALDDGEADLAAAGLTYTESRGQRYWFTPPYKDITQQLVYRVGTPRPDDLSEIGPGELAVIANSSHADRLRELRNRSHPDLTWAEDEHADSEAMLYRVWNEELRYTVADSHELSINRAYYPELRKAFEISGVEGLAWAFPRTEDLSLYNEAARYFTDLRLEGTLSTLLEEHFGHLGRFDYVGFRAFNRHVADRLPRYRHWFEEAAEEYGVDWRLLAAIGYQESHWDPQAVSPTGVRGIMMLTLDTASMLGVDNRLDPKQSIFGGARYFSRLLERLPEDIEEPHRAWMALAAYNVGYGHLQDARRLARQRGYDPNDWRVIRDHLPLLSQRQWYVQTRHGYARGWEPVHYVRNIRLYYQLLQRITEPGRRQVPAGEALGEPPLPTPPAPPGAPLPADPPAD